MMKTLQYFPGLFGVILAEMLAGVKQGYMICFYSHPRTPTLVAYTFQLFLQAQTVVSDSSALSDSYFYLSFISWTPWKCLQKRRWMNADLTSSSSPSMKIIFPSGLLLLVPLSCLLNFCVFASFILGGFMVLVFFVLFFCVCVISELIIVISREIDCSNSSYSTC